MCRSGVSHSAIQINYIQALQVLDDEQKPLEVSHEWGENRFTLKYDQCGYVGDFIVENGQLDISNAGISKADICTIGLRYEGILKSFNLGYSIQNISTQSLPKNIYKAVIMFLNSAGGMFGDNLYNLVPIQKFNPDGLFDSIPLPMDDDEEISYCGEFSEDKRFFIVQREPLPLQVSMVIPYFEQSTTN